MVDNIGIVDTRNIISAVTDTYGIDMSDYTFTILKRRLIHAINTFVKSWMQRIRTISCWKLPLKKIRR